MGRCLKCSHYDICSDDRINSEEVWGQCRYFEDDSVSMVPKSEYDALKEQLARVEMETARKIFSDLDECINAVDYRSYWDEGYTRRSIKDLKKKYKLEG